MTNENDGVAELVQNGLDAVAVQIPDQKVENPLRDMIDSLGEKIHEFSHRMSLIASLEYNDRFKNLSKRNRNALMSGLLNESRDIEEMSKVVFRALKKIKRERMHEDEVDSLLGLPDHMKAKGDSEEESDVEE